jgi:hypothetical protein
MTHIQYPEAPKFWREEGIEVVKSALKYYNQAIRYLPVDNCLLATRGMCRYEPGDNTGACQDWNRIKALQKLRNPRIILYTFSHHPHPSRV